MTNEEIITEVYKFARPDLTVDKVEYFSDPDNLIESYHVWATPNYTKNAKSTPRSICISMMPKIKKKWRQIQLNKILDV